MEAAGDPHSAVLAWLLGAAGCALAAVAAQVCHAKSTTAHFCLLLSALCTVQLLVLVSNCVSYRSWVVTSTNAPRLGPGQQWPRVRRGLPAVKSASKLAGLDGWSALIIGLLVVPIAVSALAFLQPSEKLRFKTAYQQQLGIARGTSRDSRRNGGQKYTVAAYEAVLLSITSKAPGNSQTIMMSNTASVAIDTNANRAYVPSHVDAACLYPEVTAKNITAMVGTYTCDSQDRGNFDCKQNSIGKGKGCVNLRNGTGTLSAPDDQYMTVIYNGDMQVSCSVKYSIAWVDVTWRGDDKGFPGTGRNCRIAKFAVIAEVQNTSPSYWTTRYGIASQDLLGNYLQPLSLPLWNAFYHTVGHDNIKNSLKEEMRDFHGSIFAAATIIRATGLLFDPTQSNDTVQVHYATQVCQQYGWSGFIIFLIVANALLVLCCTIVSSDAYQQDGGLQGLLSSLLCCKSTPEPHSEGPKTTAGSEAGSRVPAGLLNSMTSIQTSQPSNRQSHASGPVGSSTATGR